MKRSEVPIPAGSYKEFADVFNGLPGMRFESRPTDKPTRFQLTYKQNFGDSNIAFMVLNEQA